MPSRTVWQIQEQPVESCYSWPALVNQDRWHRPLTQRKVSQEELVRLVVRDGRFASWYATGSPARTLWTKARSGTSFGGIDDTFLTGDYRLWWCIGVLVGCCLERRKQIAAPNFCLPNSVGAGILEGNGWYRHYIQYIQVSPSQGQITVANLDLNSKASISLFFTRQTSSSPWLSQFDVSHGEHRSMLSSL